MGTTNKRPREVAQEVIKAVTNKTQMKSIISQLQKAIEKREKSREAVSPLVASTADYSIDFVKALKADEASLKAALGLQEQTSETELLLRERVKHKVVLLKELALVEEEIGFHQDNLNDIKNHVAFENEVNSFFIKKNKIFIFDANPQK